MICLSLTAPTLRENLEALTFYHQWTDIAEIRVDKLTDEEREALPPWLDRQHGQSGISFIVTLRLPRDGGAWQYGEDLRRSEMLRIVESVHTGTVARIDLEDDISWPEVEAAAAVKKIGEIRSFHDFSGTPGNLLERMRADRRARPETAAGPVVVKAAVMPSGSRDLLNIVAAAVELGREPRKDAPFILLGMGPFGTATRVLSPVWGSWLTFTSAALPGHPPAAPGHMDPKTLAELYGYKTIGPRTRIFGIAGNPVAHSKSPAFHNPRLREAGIDACYLPFLVDDMDAFLALGNLIDLRGCSVTIPHKEAAAERAGELADSARLIGASNTLIRRGKTWFGTNTDAPGFYKPLKDRFPAGGEGLKALVVGAGGAARGIAVALLENGFEICILNRTFDRAAKLRDDLSEAFPGRIAVGALPSKTKSAPAAGSQTKEARGLATRYSDLIVQTSSMGMEGEFENEDPLWFYEFSGAETAYDIVYTPPRTPFLERAERAGCRVLNGEHMFEQQALLQLDLFIEAGKA